MAKSLLHSDLLRRLDQLELQPRRVLGGVLRGERRSRKRGQGIDFADYRHYTSGDDLRFIDWNIYGRLDRLFVKLFQEEQDLQVHILLDTSRSMAYGDPPKIDFARRAAAAIAYVALTGQDKLSLTCFQAEPGARFGPARGRHHVRRLFGMLDSIEPDGRTSLRAICRGLAQRVRGRSLVIVISDFLDPEGFEPALRWLVRDSFDVTVLHTLAPQEIDPKLTGHLELRDMETDHKVEVTVTPRLKAAYKRNLEAYITQIQQYCTRLGMLYMLLPTDTPIEDLVLKRLREGGLLRT